MRWVAVAMSDEIPAGKLHGSSAASLIQPSPKSRFRQFEQTLTQIHLNSDSPKAALMAMLEKLGDVMSANACLLVMRHRDQSYGKALCWKSGTYHEHVTQGEALSTWLQNLQWQDDLKRNDVVAISDVQNEPSIFQIAHSIHGLSRPSTSQPQQDSSTWRLTDVVSLRAMLVAKTSFQGNPNGVIILTQSHPHSWTESDVQLLKTFSNQAAIAISQLQLEEQIQQQVRYQALIDQLTEAIRTAWDLERIFQLATDGIVSSLQLSQGMVLSLKYVDPQFKGRVSTRLPRCRATVEYIHLLNHPERSAKATTAPVAQPEATWLKHTFQFSDCSVGHHILANVGQPVVIPSANGSTDSGWAIASASDRSVEPLFDLAVMPSLLAVPLENQGVILGCLILQHCQVRCWQPEEVAFVKLIAAHLGTAMIQTRTLRQVQSLVEERTAQLRHSLDVQAKLYEKTRHQVEQMRRLNQVMEEFLSTVSHELLTPLTSMKVAIRMLREANLTPEQRDRYLNILEAQCLQETRLINDLLALQKLEAHSGAIQVQQLDVRQVLCDFEQAWGERLAAQQLNLEVEVPSRPLLMRTDPESLHRIITELLTNAQKYSESGSTIYLGVSADTLQSLPHIQIAVRNTGVGITSEELPVIFEKFRRGHAALKRAIPGIGLGLALVKGLTAHLSGAIAATSDRIENSESWKTCFVLTLPQSPELSC